MDSAQALAETGYRAEAVFERYAEGPTELIVALGREGKQQLQFDQNDAIPILAADERDQAAHQHERQHGRRVRRFR